MVVVEISGGDLATRQESNKHVESNNVRRPILWDECNRNHKNYGILSWPAAYLIDAEGKVFWQGNPARMETRTADAENFRNLVKRNLKSAGVVRK